MINMNNPKTKRTIASVIAAILVVTMVIGIFAPM